jgi:hypothetical protein
MLRVAMMPGMAQAKLDSSGMNARQVAAVFQHQDEEEQDQDLRQEHQYRAQAREHAVVQQAMQRAAGGKETGGPDAQPGDACLDAIHHRLRPGKHRLEDEEHQPGQDHHAHHRMQCPAVQRVVDGGGFARHGDGGGKQLTDLRMHLGGGERDRIRRRGFRHVAVDTLDQRLRTAPLHGHGLHHRHAKAPLQFVDVDHDAAPFGGVHHVQRQHHRAAQLAHFQHEAQVQAQVRGIGDADDEVGRSLARIASQADIAGDGFVRAGGGETVGAREIKQLEAAARRRHEAAFLALHGNAGVIGHLLPATGELVEQRGFAAVRVADQGNAQDCLAHAVASWLTVTRAASDRRSAKRVEPICTSSGSPPSGPRATMRTGSPLTKPSSRRRWAMGSAGWASSTSWTMAGAPLGNSDNRTNEYSNKNSSHYTPLYPFLHITHGV